MADRRVEINPEIMGGKPVIRGTRVPVETVMRKLGAGMTIEAILADHPRLTQDDVLAAQSFAADYLTRDAVTRRVQALARDFIPDGVSLVDELLEDRRREVESEREED